VDKTVRVTRGNNWAVKRVSAAVVVNYHSTEEKGKTVTKALTPDQVEQMTALVRETIGYNKERGDSVNLMNAQFQIEAAPVDNTPLWRQPETVDLARSLAWPVGMALFAALVLLGLVRPALKALGNPRAIPMAGAQLDALEADTPQRPALPPPQKPGEPVPPTPEELRLDEARALARQNPMAVANIVKNWVNGDIG
jgi:flagellar M-ring protein FliF